MKQQEKKTLLLRLKCCIHFLWCGPIIDLTTINSTKINSYKQKRLKNNLLFLRLWVRYYGLCTFRSFVIIGIKINFDLNLCKTFFRLKESGLHYRFVTNSSKESTACLHQRLVGMGLNVTADDVFTSLSAAKRLIISRNLRPMLFLENTALDEFEGNFLQHF